MSRKSVGIGGALGLLCLATAPALAAQPVAPPAMYPADTWQGKETAVVRVLNRLDSHVETLRIKGGGTTRYETLELTVGRCLLQAPTLRRDAAVWMDIVDSRSEGASFHGWMLAAEPSLGILESPIYDVRIVTCEGADAAPALPALAQPSIPSLPGGDAASPAAEMRQGGEAAGTTPPRPSSGAPRTLPAEGGESQPSALGQY